MNGHGSTPMTDQLEFFDPARATAADRDADVRLEELAPGVAGVIFHARERSQNVLTKAVLDRLDEIVRAIRSATGYRAVLITSTLPGSFIAGADVNEIASVDDVATGRDAARRGQRVFGELAALTIPTVAAIGGACLGGGLELALACHYRIASDSSKVRLGLPEVRLGIIPGFGGTQRLPRLVGLPAAIDLILTGKTLDARRARRRGLVDLVIPEILFRQESLRFVERLAAGEAPSRHVMAFSGPRKAAARRAPLSARDRFLESPVGRPILFRLSRRSVLSNTKGHYQAPLDALTVIEDTFGKPIEEGLDVEAAALGRRLVTQEKKALVHVFFLTEANRKDTGSDDASLIPRPITRAGLLGAGVMGGGIAQLLSRRDIRVRMKDLNDDALLSGLRSASNVTRSLVRRRRMRPAEAARQLALISPTTEYTGFGRVDVVFEAVVEKMDVKKTVLGEVERVVRPGTIIASNTSALSITELATVSRRPEHVAGFHFFNPVHRMPLVEVVRGERTSDAAVVTLVALARRLGKTPIVCNDGPGFLVNRILGRYMNEASHLLADGVAIEHCDCVATDFGMPMGPIRLVDEVGADVAAKVASLLLAGLGDRFKTNNLIERLVGEGRLGKKCGRGFYTYPGARGGRLPAWTPSWVPGAPREHVDRGVLALIETGGRRSSLSDREIRDRLVYVMVDEAARCLDDGIVASPRDVDLGMIFGTGFPPFRGGLLRFADETGVDVVADTLSRLADSASPRFAPCDRLRDMGNRALRFHPS